MNPFGLSCDDFGVNLYLAAKTDLPTSRETVLHFFEAMQKQYPSMTEFEKRDGPEFALEEDREAGSYRWLTLDSRRVCSGFLNPPDVTDADLRNTNTRDPKTHRTTHELHTEAHSSTDPTRR